MAIYPCTYRELFNIIDYYLVAIRFIPVPTGNTENKLRFNELIVVYLYTHETLILD